MPVMKFSVMEWCSRPKTDDPAAYYRRVKDLGYGGVELPSLDAAPAVQAAGLTAVNVAAPGFSEGLCHRKNHAALVPQITATIREAKARGIEQVILFSGDARGVEEAEGLQSCIAGIKQVAGIAEQLGVTLVLEMFNTFDHPGYLAVSGRFGFDVARGVSSPNVKLLYDIYHMARMKQDVLGDLTANLKFVGHLHIAGSPRRDYPGKDQEIDYPAVVKKVVAAGYRGWWGMEFFAKADPYQELGDALKLFRSLG